MSGASVWGGSECSTLFMTPPGEFLSTVLPTGRMCTASDMERGQLVIAWAIAEDPGAACGLNCYLMDHSYLSAPLPL